MAYFKKFLEKEMRQENYQHVVDAQNDFSFKVI